MTSMEVLRTGVPVVAAVAGDASSATHRRGVRLARGAEDLRAATTGVPCAVRAAREEAVAIVVRCVMRGRAGRASGKVGASRVARRCAMASV